MVLVRGSDTLDFGERLQFPRLHRLGMIGILRVKVFCALSGGPEFLSALIAFIFHFLGFAAASGDDSNFGDPRFRGGP